MISVPFEDISTSLMPFDGELFVPVCISVISFFISTNPKLSDLLIFKFCKVQLQINMEGLRTYKRD